MAEFEPITFNRTSADGEDQQLVAHTPAEEVHLRYEGWTEKGAKAAKSAPRAAGHSTPSS
jgi:hypothetical protein